MGLHKARIYRAPAEMQLSDRIYARRAFAPAPLSLLNKGYLWRCTRGEEAFKVLFLKLTKYLALY